MKKLITAIAVFAILLILASCNSERGTDLPMQPESSSEEVKGIESTLPSGEKVILPPVRMTTEENFHITDCFEEDPTLEKVISSADAVAHIRIGNWIGEDRKEQSTQYEAETVTLYKGELPQNFVFSVLGASDATYVDLPLPTYGNEFLVILGYTERKDRYSPCLIHYFFEIVEDEDGEQYLIGSSFLENGGIVFEDYSEDEALRERIERIRAEKDDYYSDADIPSSLNKLDEVAEYINGLEE